MFTVMKIDTVAPIFRVSGRTAEGTDTSAYVHGRALGSLSGVRRAVPDLHLPAADFAVWREHAAREPMRAVPILHPLPLLDVVRHAAPFDQCRPCARCARCNRVESRVRLGPAGEDLVRHVAAALEALHADAPQEPPHGTRCRGATILAPRTAPASTA